MLHTRARHPSRPVATCTNKNKNNVVVVDVRTPQEVEVESVPGAINIPLPQMRARMNELPKDKEILVFCRSAQRSYYATRILMQNGFKVKNISGSLLARSHRAEN